MDFNYQLVDKILNAILPLPENFGIDELYDEPNDLLLFKNKLHEVDKEAIIFFGLTKMVISSPQFNGVVIKIPFNGRYGLDDNEKPYWIPFKWADASDRSDYCLAEWEKYNKLKKYRLNCFVAKTLYYKQIMGVRIFIQEQVTPLDEFYKIPIIPSKNSQKLANQWWRERKIDINPNWMANCLDLYGQAKVKKFLNYCENIDPDILEDAHSGNIGYRTNGTPVILDYSNYLDS